MTHLRAVQYVRTWKARGYPSDIPDTVPLPLLQQQLAPSYQAIALALLRNDMQLHSLGFSRPASAWYGALKRVELRLPAQPIQLRFAFMRGR
jgi:predicted phosphoadenosine phosphosulfate sulfurtransferase